MLYTNTNKFLNSAGLENKELVILDVECSDKYHLPQDDYFYATLFSKCFNTLKIISAPIVIDKILNSRFKNIKCEVTLGHSPQFKFKKEGILYIFRMLCCRRLSNNSIILLPVFYELALILFKKIRARKLPVYGILHNNLALTKGAGFVKKLKRFLLGRAVKKMDGLFVFTDFARDEFLSQYPSISSSKVHLIPLYFAGVTKEIINERISNTFLFIGIGRYEKGIDKFMEMLRSSYFKDWHFVLSGKNELVELNSNEIKNSGRIQVKEEYLNEFEYNQTFYQCTFLVLPYEISYKGKLSGVFCDAISSGTPVIVPEFAPFTDYFKKFGDLGIMVNFDNPQWCKDLRVKVQNFDYHLFLKNCILAREYHSAENVQKIILDCIVNDLNESS